MKKYLIFYFFITNVWFICGQNMRTIAIEAVDARPLNLSEIAEHVTPIVLEKSVTLQNIFLTSEYLFGASISSVIQFDSSGKFIRSIDCGGYVTSNVTADTINKELYVPVGEKMKCYDFSGNFKREFSLIASSIYCLYHKGFLWVQCQQFLPDARFIFFLYKINPTTSETTTFPFDVKYEPLRDENGNVTGAMGANGCLSIYNDEVVVSLNRERALYTIQQGKCAPLIQWDISPPLNAKEPSGLYIHGFIGKYLIIEYPINTKSSTFLENVETGDKYNINQLVDDVFNTNGHCYIRLMAQKGYFYFSKERREIKENSIGNIPPNSGQVIFIVKTK